MGKGLDLERELLAINVRQRQTERIKDCPWGEWQTDSHRFIGSFPAHLFFKEERNRKFIMVFHVLLCTLSL
jgi:hypothetical protein